MEKLRNLSIYLTCFCSFLFMFAIKVGESDLNTLYIQISSLFTLLFFVFAFVYFMYNASTIIIPRHLIMLYVLIIIFSSYNLIHYLTFHNYPFLYVIIKLMPLGLFILLSTLINNNEILYTKILKYIILFSILGMIIAFIIYLAGYSQIIFSSQSIFILVPKELFIQMYGEERLTGLNSHKLRFGVYCIIGMYFLLRHGKIRNTYKIIMVFIIFINLYHSDSYLSLAAALVVVWMYTNIQIPPNNRYLKIINIVIIFGILTFALYYLFESVIVSRDFFSGNGRTYIWRAGIDFIRNHPEGVGYISQGFSLSTAEFPGVKIANGHNLFINEMIESGVFGGLLYVLIMLEILRVLLVHVKDKLSTILFMIIILLSMFDHVIVREITYIFWITICLLTLKSKVIKYN